MPLYSYTCPVHGEFDSLHRGDNEMCPHGDQLGRRVFAWTTGTVLHEHFNPAFGTTVTSLRHARELAKIASADQSERLGMDVNYELTQLHDYESAGIDKAEKEEVAARTAEAKA